MHEELVTVIDETNNEYIRNKIINGLRAYNAPYIGDFLPKPFIVYAKNPVEHIVGGLVADILHRYARVNYVWIDEPYRKLGLGKKLFKALTQYALTNGCKVIQLDTFDFQAKHFYEKLGFFCVGTISQWVEGHDCHFMRKHLT